MKRILALLLSAFLVAGCVPAVTAFSAALPPDNATLPPDNLKVNLLREGYNVEYAEDITLTWIFQDSDFDEMQTAYCLELGTGPETFDTYGTGWVSTAAASHIVPANTLAPNTLYHWRVKTRDKSGAESDWSQPVDFVTAVGSEWASTNGVWLAQGVSNPALSWTDYTIEQDITITAVALGVYFRATDDTHAYMWQFRIDRNVIVPHFGNNTAMAIEGADIPLPAGTLAANKTVRVKIRVQGANPVQIAAYIDDTPDNGEDNYVLAGERSYTAAAQRIAAGSVGYRTGNSERGYVDNVVVRSYPAGEVLYENDFTAATPNQFGSGCTIDSGRLNVGTGARAVLNPNTAPSEKGNFIFLRHTFPLAGTANIRKAVVSGGAYMVESGTGDDSLSYIYDLYINGQSVGVGPARVHKYNMSGGLNTTAPNLYYYNSFDVTDLLKDGENVIAASNYSRSGKSVLFQLTVFYEDGTKAVLINSARDRAQWRAKDGTGAFGDNRSFTNGGYVTQALEEMNGLYYPTGWNDVGFVEDASWRVPNDKGQIDASPRIFAPYTAENILRFDMPAVSRTVVNAGGHEYQVLDLGKGIVGGIRLAINNTTGSPFTLVVQPGESLIKATDPNPDSSTSGPVGTVRYDGWRDNPNYNMTWTIAPGLNVLPSMLMYNYRWIQFVDAPIEITTDMVTGLHVRQAFDDDASYLRSGDNEFFNQLVELVKYSIKATNQDQYTDSYSRERRAYEGDLILNQYGSYAFSDNYALARHTNQYLMDWPTWPPEYRLFSIEMAWADYLYTGDRANLEKYYTLLDRKLPTSYGGAVNYQSGFNETVGLCRDNRSAQSGGAIVDWPADEQDGYIRDGANSRQALNTTVGSFTTVYNAVAYGAYGDMARIAALLGRADEAAWYQDKADAIKASLIEKLYNPETGAFWDSCRADGTRTTHTAQHATAYALAYGVYTDQAMADKMVAFLRSYKALNEGTQAAQAYRGGYLRTSVYGAYFVLRGLYDAGAGDLAGEIMLEDDPSVVRSWAQMIETQQATITTEAWSPQLKNNMTYSHPWGSTPGALITQGIFGIKPLSPGFSLFQIKLQPGAELRTAEIKSPSVKGPICVSFDAGAAPAAFTANVTIPANARARVSIPADDPAREALVINGVKTPAVNDGRFLTVELGSGEYEIQVDGEYAAAAVRVTNLQTEYETNPLGLDETHPRLSWVLDSDVRGVRQQSYQIAVTKGAPDGPVVWTAAETSDNTLNIPYKGEALEPTTRYYWRVTVQTNVGPAVSEPAWFETGFMNPTSAAWDGALWLTKPTDTANPDVADYTIEYDFRMVKDGGGMIFASAGNNYLMWQFNINPVERPYGGTPYFRPHRWNPGGASMAEIKIDNVIPDNEEGKHAWYRCRIVVRESQNGAVITTSVGPKGGALTVIDDARAVAGTWKLGKIGFRQIHDNNNEEITEYDNIQIWDNTGDSDRLLYAETFDSAPTGMFGTRGTTQNGVYRVDGETFTGSRNVVDPAPPEGGEPLFRKEFAVDKPVKSARLYATARGYYEFSLNGEKVGDIYLAPGWTDYYYTIMYQVYDVTGMLRPGGNAIGGMLGMGWYSGPHQLYGYNMYGSTQSLLGKLVITYEDGTEQVIVTDGSWRYHPGPILYAENYAGETYDARYDCAGWNTAGYDAAGWTPAGIHTPPPATVQLVPQIGPPVREVERFENPILTEPVSGQYTYDFGQNIAGFVTIKVKGAAGTRIMIRHGEMLNTASAYKNPGEAAVNNGDGPIGTVYRANLRDQQVPVAYDYYTLKGDPAGETYTPRFTFHGFRYIEITGVDEAIPPEDVTAIAISSDNALTSAFETSNPKVNQLYSNVVWGMRGNFVSIPTDCPNRDERLGYTGDTQIFAGTGVYLANADRFYAKWLRDLRDYQLNEETSEAHKGLVPVLIPAVRTSGFTQWSNAWGDGAVIVPWQMYQQYGDEQIIRDSFESMKAWCDFLNAPERSSGYIRNRYTGRDNNYGDWVSVVDSPRDMTNTLFSAYSNKLFAKMARVIGETAIADQYEAVTQNIVNAFMATFRNADGTLKATTQTPYAMLIYFGLTDEADNAFLAEKLMENIRDRGWTLSSGFIGISYLTPALSQNGQPEAAFRLLEQEKDPSWIYSINQGATTTWERWNSYTVADGFGPTGMNSFNHYAFGSIGEWMMSGVLGIRRDEAAPGFRHFVLDPQYGGTLTYARGRYDSVSGRVESAWTWDQDTGDFAYNFTVPANTSATVLVPTQNPALVREGTKTAAEAEGVTYLGYDEATQRAAYEVLSGSYAFTSAVAVIGERYDLTVQSDTPDAVAEVTTRFATGEARSQKTPALVTVGSKETLSLSVRPYNDVDFAFEAWEDGTTDNPRTVEGVTGEETFAARFKWIGGENLLAGSTVTAQANHTNEMNGAWGRGNLIDGLLTARNGRNGWTSAIVGENPTGNNIPTVTFDMGAPKPFNRIQLYPRSDAFTMDGKMAGFPRDFRLEGSQNGSDWTVIRSETDAEPPYFAPYVINFETQTWRYLRIVCTRLGTPASDDGGGTNYRMQLSEMGAYLVTGSEPEIQALRVDVTDRANVRIYINGTLQPAPYLGIFPKGEDVQVRFASRYAGEYGVTEIDGADLGDETRMEYTIRMDEDRTLLAHTGWVGPLNLARGKVPVAADNAMSAPTDGTWGANNLVDGERLSRSGKGGFTTNIYHSRRDISGDPHKITIDLETVKNVDRVYLYPRTDALTAEGGYANYPQDFTIQLSVDGTNYETVKTVTNESAPTEAQGRGEYVFDFTQARYVRVVTTMLGLSATNENAAYNRLQLAEIEVYGKADFAADFAFDAAADRETRTVTVTGSGFEPGERVWLRIGYNYTPAETDDYHAYVAADDSGRMDVTLPAEATADLPWVGGHRCYVTLGGPAESAAIPAKVRAHSSARISLRIKGKAPLNLDVEALPREAYTVTSSNTAIATADMVNGAWVVTGKKAGTALVVVRASDEFGGATHLVTVSVT